MDESLPVKGPRTGTLMWLPVVLDDERLDPVETLILVGLVEHINGDDECFVGIDHLAVRGRCSYSTAQRRLKSLTEKGAISRERRRREDGNLSVYSYKLARAFFGISPVSLPGDHRSPRRPVTTGHPGDRAELPHDELPHKDGAPPELPVIFEAFWDVYPRKREKQAAAKAWKTRVKEGVDPQELIEAANNYAESASGQEIRFMKHAATFIGPNAPWQDWLDGGEALNESERANTPLVGDWGPSPWMAAEDG